MNKEITITISGATGSGKSAITQRIIEALKEDDIKVTATDLDGENQLHFTPSQQMKRLMAVRQNTNITIEQKSWLRLPKESK